MQKLLYLLLGLALFSSSPLLADTPAESAQPFAATAPVAADTETKEDDC